MNKQYKHLSEEFFEKDFKSWAKENHYLIAAETSAGKSTLMLDKFTEWAKKSGENVLFLCNRKAMLNQFAHKYAEKHENLTVMLYQTLEDKAKTFGAQNFVDSFSYVICDEVHYWLSDHFNFTTFLSFNAVNNCKNTAIFLTGTPDYFMKLSDKFKKPLKVLRKVNHYNNNVKRVFISKNKKFVEDMQLMRLQRDEHVIQFNKYVSNLLRESDEFSKYTSAVLMSERNDLYFLTNKKVEKEILNSTEQGKDIANVSVKWLGCTSAYENGVNFNIEGSVLVVFPSYINWTSLEQSRSRVRNFKNTSVDIVIYVPRTPTLEKEKDNLIKIIADLKDVRKAFKELDDIDLDEILALPAYKDGEFGIENYQDYIDYNEMTLLAYETQLEEIETLLNVKDRSKYYYKKISELYPNAEIKFANKNHTIDYDSIMKEFINEDGSDTWLDKEQQNKLGAIFAELKVDEKHATNKVGVNKIGKELKENHSLYSIESKNKRDGAKVKTKWLLRKIA